jgi:ABC-type transport system involved in multi-copper enzyme maturation permease subunit
MRRLMALVLNTFREAVRDRVLYSILFFGVAVVMLSVVLRELTVGDQEKVVRSVAQSGIDLFGSIIAMFLGISLVWKEIERKTVYTILSKPVPRWMFILGKYLGLMLTLVVELLILVAIYTLMMVFEQGFPPLVVYQSMGLLVIELGLLTAWATLFSTYSAPTTAAAFTLAVFVVGHLADDVWLYGSQAESVGLREAARALYYMLPNFELLSIRSDAANHRPVSLARLFSASAYGLAYTGAVLSAAMLVFQRRDMR